MANVAMKSAFSRLVAAVSKAVDKIAGKANATHTHDISDITGLQDALNDKVDASLLQVEQSAREAEDNSLLSLINTIHSLVNTDETKLASLEAKVANRG